MLTTNTYWAFAAWQTLLCFTYTDPFKAHNNVIISIRLQLFPFLRGGNEDSERLSDFPRITQDVQWQCLHTLK